MPQELLGAHNASADERLRAAHARQAALVGAEALVGGLESGEVLLGICDVFPLAVLGVRLSGMGMAEVAAEVGWALGSTECCHAPALVCFLWVALLHSHCVICDGGGRDHNPHGTKHGTQHAPHATYRMTCSASAAMSGNEPTLAARRGGRWWPGAACCIG